MKWIFGVLLAAACGFGQAAETKSTGASCEALGASIDTGLKDLSSIRAEGLGDNSAPRESNRQMQKLVTINLMQMNLALLQANRCAIPKDPFSDSTYYSEALRCVTATLKAESGAKDMPTECDRSKWSKSVR